MREQPHVLLVCSAGGHFLQLRMLAGACRDLPHTWVTLDRDDVRSLLGPDDDVVFAHGPTTRSVANLVRNLLLAWKVVRDRRPWVILTTGAGIAVPFAWIGRFHGARIVYVESLTRVERPSVSLRLIRPVADRIYVQWPELSHAVANARYVGSVISPG